MNETEDQRIQEYKENVIYKVVTDFCRKDEVFGKWLRYQLDPNSVEAPLVEETGFGGGD